MKKENKQTRIFLRVTEREKNAWTTAAKEQGLILSKYIRDTMNAASEPQPHSPSDSNTQ